MKKLSFLLLIILATIILQFCTAHKKAMETHAATVTYTGNIQPILMAKCTPCHFPPKGNKEPLDTYERVKDNVDGIIARIQKSPEERGFMPMRHPKLSDSTINLIVQWKAEGLAEK